MPNIRVHRQSAPNNVTSGDFIWSVEGTHACGSTVQPIVYDDSLLSATPPLTAGRWVAIKAASITGYAGASVTAPTGLSVYSVSQEPVNFAGTTFQCIVVTLV